jgi:RNA polymerase sigma-70 factor (ECF subfamily)
MKIKLLLIATLLASACFTFIPLAAEEVSIESLPPVVIKTIPEAGSSDIAPGMVEIRITFSKPMRDKSWSFTLLNGKKNAPQDVTNLRFEDDGRTFVTLAKLEPNTTYACTANSTNHKNFKDTDGNSALPYLIVFKTKAK